jgi:hypothetical protein
MAIINVEFDTKLKTMSAMIDGKEVENVVGVHLGSCYDEPDKYSCCITTSSKNEDEDTHLWTQICASETVDDKADFVKSDFVDFIQAKVDGYQKVFVDIANYFKK